LPHKISFLLISRLIKEKGILDYVEAARIVKQRRPEVEFKLVGFFDKNPSALKEIELQSWIQEGVLHYLGKLDDVRPAIALSSVYVLPSYYGEGTPRTVLEAMAMGRPIITTDSPGCRETVVDGENGFLVPVKDPLSLSKSMLRFIENPTLIEQMGKISREIAIKKYDVNKVNSVILQAMEL
jgi:glycosyltransferase involved in cell wall biosynthesis